MEEERKLSRGKRKEYDDISATLPINSLRGVEPGGASVCFRVAKQASIGWTGYCQNDSPTIFGNFIASTSVAKDIYSQNALLRESKRVINSESLTSIFF